MLQFAVVVQVSQPDLHGTQSPFGLIKLFLGQIQVLSVDKTNPVLQVWQVNPFEHLSQYWIHFWQNLTPFVLLVKNVPTAQEHVPSPLFEAWATQVLHSFDELHLAQPEAHYWHVLLLSSKYPSAQTQICSGNLITLLIDALHWMHKAKFVSHWLQNVSDLQLLCIHDESLREWYPDLQMHVLWPKLS